MQKIITETEYFITTPDLTHCYYLGGVNNNQLQLINEVFKLDLNITFVKDERPPRGLCTVFYCRKSKKWELTNNENMSANVLELFSEKKQKYEILESAINKDSNESIVGYVNRTNKLLNKLKK